MQCRRCAKILMVWIFSLRLRPGNILPKARSSPHTFARQRSPQLAHASGTRRHQHAPRVRATEMTLYFAALHLVPTCMCITKPSIYYLWSLRSHVLCASGWNVRNNLPRCCTRGKWILQMADVNMRIRPIVRQVAMVGQYPMQCRTDVCLQLAQRAHCSQVNNRT